MSQVIEFPQEEPQPKSEYKPDDDVIASEIAVDWKDKTSYYYGDWRVYEDGCWRVRDVHEVRKLLRKSLRAYRKRGVPVTQARVAAISAMLEDDMYVPDRLIIESHAEASKYLNLRNGLFNLHTMQLEKHRRDLYFTSQFDFDYQPDAECPAFMNYLDSSLVLPGTEEPDYQLFNMVLEAMGYSLTARTDLKASFWLVGKPDSGKSTLIALLKNLFGSLHGTIDLTQLGANRFMLSEIIGKRVITFTENSSNNVLPDALYKALVGGQDEVYSDVKNRPGISFRPEAKLWWGMNEKPRILDRSGATFNRLHIIPFNRSIPVHQRISNLEELLTAERSGILNFMLAGYQRLARNGGFTMPAQSQQMREKYRFESDTEATFVEECCECHPDYKVKADALFQCYRMWSERNGFKNKNRNQVSGDWERLGFHSRKSGTIFWHGVRLREDWDVF